MERREGLKKKERKGKGSVEMKDREVEERGKKSKMKATSEREGKQQRECISARSKRGESETRKRGVEERGGIKDGC